MKQARFVKCNGEAHRNPFIDHCMACAPFWGEYPVCPECGGSLIISDSQKTGSCRKCFRRWSLRRPSVFRELMPGVGLAVMGGERNV